MAQTYGEDLQENGTLLRTILVDDEEKALERMNRLCRKCAGIEVRGAFQRPAEAILHAEREHVDLALLDIEMPKMSGLDLAEKLQELHPDMDVVFVTAFDKYALEAFQVNAVGYLLKPIAMADLEQQIGHLLRRREKHRVPYEKRRLRILCMGGFKVFKDRDMSEILHWRTAKAEELFALLIHSRGKPMTKDRILELLWPDMDYDKASRNLHSISYYIRDALHGLGYDDLFVRSGGQYHLKFDRLNLDVAMIESLLTQTPLRAITAEGVEMILKLAGGAYFEGKEYGWAASTDAWLQNRMDEVALIQAERLIEEGRADEAIDSLTGTIRRNPCSEGAYKLLIRTCLDLGNLPAARQWYGMYERNLNEELDAEPDEEIRRWMK